MAYKQKVLGAINASGAEKNYKFMYMKHLMDRIVKIYDQVPGETSVTKIVALRDEAIGYVDNENIKNDITNRADKLAHDLKEQFKAENGGQADNEHKIEANRIAAIRAVGWVLKYFDSAWGWSTRRGILIAGPFGDGRRRFLALGLLPEDGFYLKVSEDYIAHVVQVKSDDTPLPAGKYLRLPDEFDMLNEGNVVHQLRLRQLLLNNNDEEADAYNEVRQESDAQDQSAVDIPATESPVIPEGGENNGGSST